MKSLTTPLTMWSIISLIMSGTNYYREVYQNMKCKEIFYMFFDIVDKKKCEWPCKLCDNISTTMNTIQCDVWRVVSLVCLSTQRIFKLNISCLSIIFDPTYNYIISLTFSRTCVNIKHPPSSEFYCNTCSTSKKTRQNTS